MLIPLLLGLAADIVPVHAPLSAGGAVDHGSAASLTLQQGGQQCLTGIATSGSTLIAAEQTGRKAFLMELDPLYCDVIVQRWEQFTGQKAKCA